MRAGLLDRKVIVQSRTVTQDADYGSEQVTWGTFATVWARFQETGGAEEERNNREFTVRNATVTIRWISGVTADMRLSESDGSVWQIINVRPGAKRNRELILEVTEYARG